MRALPLHATAALQRALARFLFVCCHSLQVNYVVSVPRVKTF